MISPLGKYNNPCISLLKSNRCTILFGDLELANTTIAYDHEIFTDHMQSFLLQNMVYTELMQFFLTMTLNLQT